jgi:hypothetical protein
MKSEYMERMGDAGLERGGSRRDGGEHGGNDSSLLSPRYYVNRGNGYQDSTFSFSPLFISSDYSQPPK